ncbi:uncharacterized protein LOC113136045 [Mastacembelus armatus]|uniref:uncharacterized protein LOC113136045 n=1 Tax=Mastacembelus armatus TaxID=205130 RepID=UPI000E454174|nr:uncharacterized protein LOC113136045 [Mastacembelus armatus]XP_026172288.1 uncharacterized protein LOC113136045 [Mastacembelus armatus]
MADETTVQTSNIQEKPDADECRENIPPGDAASCGTSGLSVQVGDVIGYPSAQPGGDDRHLCDTPLPTNNNEVKAKSRLSGLQSALTPILKYLNIGNKCRSPDEHGKSPHPSGSRFHLNFTPQNQLKTTGGPGQHHNSDVFKSRFGQKDASMCWLIDECMPEITLLDDTVDAVMELTRNNSALPDNLTVTSRSGNGMFTTLQPSQSSSSTDLNSDVQKPVPQNTTQDPLQTNDSCHEAESESTDQASPVSKNATKTSLVMGQNSSAGKTSSSSDVQEILFDKDSLEKSSGNVIGEAHATDICHNSSTVDTKPPSQKNGSGILSEGGSSQRLRDIMGMPLPEPSKNNSITTKTNPGTKVADITKGAACLLSNVYFPDITLLDVSCDSVISPKGGTFCMEVTQDFPPNSSVKNSIHAVELSEQIAAEPCKSNTEEMSGALTGNTTHTLTSFSEPSEKGVLKTSLEGTVDISESSAVESSRTSSEPSEQNIVKIRTSAEDTVQTHRANLTHDISTSADSSAQCRESQVTFDHGEPMETSNTVDAKTETRKSHDTFTSEVPQQSPKASGSATIVQVSNLTASNTRPQTLGPQSKTLDSSPHNNSNPKVECDTKEQADSFSKLTTETCLTGVRNTTFDRLSIQISNVSASIEKASATNVCPQNNTFDKECPSKPSDTITLSESETHQNTLQKTSSSKVCNVTKDNHSEVHSPELSKHNSTTDRADAHKHILEIELGAEETSSESSETKENSLSGLPVIDVLSDTFSCQSTDTGINKANTFNLDDTIDLKGDSLVTSTPMINCKVLNFSNERQEDKIIGAQKKLHLVGPDNPVGQVPSDLPSNVACDRKTQPATKSLLPPSKVASQLLKCKPASAFPAGFDPLMSSLPMPRKRSQADALRSHSALDATQKTTGVSSSYNLRPTTTGCKQPSSGLPRVQLSSTRSAIQKTAAGLKLPSVRYNASTSSGTDKPHGPTAANPPMKNSQAKKHPLTRGETLPTAKKKKLDGAVPASTAETSTACNAATRATKHPAISHKALLVKPQGQGCAKCAILEEELKMKVEENKRLKEELIKLRKRQEER